MSTNTPVRFSPTIWTILILAAGALSAQSTGGVRGVVTVKGGSTLHDVTVVLLPTKRSVQTNSEGVFEFQAVPPGRYDLLAHTHGMTDQKASVEVVSGQTAQVKVELDFAPVRQEITVTASGREESVLETFSSVTSLDGQQLSLRNSAPALGEILENEPGVSKRSYGPGSSRPVIRGFDGDRVLVLQDGTRTGTLSSQSGDHGEPVDGSEIERVEIVRGPGTLMYGTNAVGGVVNVISRHHEMEQHPHAGIRGHLKALGGSNNGLGGGGGGLEYGKDNWLFWGMGSGQRTGDYKSPLGTVHNSFSNIVQGSGGLGRYADKNFLTLSYGIQDGKYGIPSAEQGSEGEQGGGHSDVNIDWRRQNVRFHGGWRNLGGWLEDSVRPRTIPTGGTSRWKATKSRPGSTTPSGHGRVSGSRRNGVCCGKLRWLGHVPRLQDGGRGGDRSTGNAELVRILCCRGAYFRATASAVWGPPEHNGYSPAMDHPSRSFTGASGSVGLFAPLWKNGALVFNYTTSYRAPALEELYNFGPHLGNLAFEIGNPNLERERAHGFELSLRHNGTRVRTEVSGYYNRIDDFVYLAPTGAIADGLVEAEYDQAAARYLGAEARLDVLLRPDLWLNLGFDAVDT